MKADFIEPGPKLRLILVPAPDDPPLSSQEFQKELSEFARSLRAQGIQIESRLFAFDAVHGGGGLSGEFTLIVTTLAPVVKAGALAVFGAWLHAKYGRKLRVKFGDIEAEAPTLEELKELLHLIEEGQQRNKPRIIHEP